MRHCKIYSPVRIFILALILSLSAMPGDTHAERPEIQRVWLGLDIFPGFLFADTDISEKTDHGRLILLLIYKNKKQRAGKRDGERAEEMASYLKKIKKIHGIPVQVEITNDTQLKKYKNKKLAGIFLTQKLGSELETIKEYGRKNRIIVFSPFKEDVEKGVPAGIFVDNLILPYVNVSAMKTF
ncbi:MAG: hypothetical protein GY795_21750, partial [Desulfobacterales bacterium]|nr:hypothetical protein [Desulfobacterales bacterium]